MKSQAQYNRACALLAQIDLALMNDDGTGRELTNARDLLDKYRDRVRPELPNPANREYFRDLNHG